MNISEESLTPQFTGTAEKAHLRPSPLVDVIVFMAAIVGHLPTFGAWWNAEDWTLLAQSAGLTRAIESFPARFISQHLYWDITWPLLGTGNDAHAVIRLVVFALCAVLVTRIAARAGLMPLPRFVAGLMVAATPVAFSALYQAAGIQELLGAVFALAAVERWLAGTRRDLILATVLAVLSMFSKEPGLGLGPLFLVMLFVGVGPQIKDRAFAWGMCFLLIVFAVIEGVFLIQNFSTGPGEEFAMGGAVQIITNLGTMGWWVLSPGPLLALDLAWPQMAGGAMLFLLWGVWGYSLFRQNNRLPLITFLAALMSIAAALPLENKLDPALGFLAVCAAALALASLIPGRWKATPQLMAGLGIVAAAWGFFSMETLLNQRDGSGMPANDLVRSTSLSWQFSRMLPQLPLKREANQRQAITILQIPMSGNQMEMADRVGDLWVTESPLYSAIGGNLGPRLVMGGETRVQWVNSLFTNPREALVLCETGTEFKHWGNTANAALYAALTDIGMGRFERARKHLVRGANLNDKTMAFTYDPGQMVISSDLVLARKKEFIDWTVSLLGPEHSPQEVGGLQDLFFNLLSTCTGKSIDELSQGGTLIIKEQIVEENLITDPKRSGSE